MVFFSDGGKKRDIDNMYGVVFCCHTGSDGSGFFFFAILGISGHE